MATKARADQQIEETMAGSVSPYNMRVDRYNESLEQFTDAVLSGKMTPEFIDTLDLIDSAKQRYKNTLYRILGESPPKEEPVPEEVPVEEPEEELLDSEASLNSNPTMRSILEEPEEQPIVPDQRWLETVAEMSQLFGGVNDDSVEDTTEAPVQETVQETVQDNVEETVQDTVQDTRLSKPSEEVEILSSWQEEKKEPTVTPISDAGKNLFRMVDGDTVVADGARHRLRGLDTPESVHPDKSRNTPEGKMVSDFAKAVVPEGANVSVQSGDGERDRYGRNLSDLKRNVNGVEIDYGLVILDQDMSEYETTFGKHPDPMQHKMYREYFSKYAPYQYGEIMEPLSQDEFSSIANKQVAFRDAYQKFSTGELSQEEFDTALVDLYQDPEKLIRFRHQAMQWGRTVESGDFNGTLRAAYDLAAQDPSFREQYNRNVRLGNLPRTSYRGKSDNSFWQNLDVSWQQYSFLSNQADRYSLQLDQKYGVDFEVPVSQMTKGVPPEYHDAITNMASTSNATAALRLRDQIIEDIENNGQLDDMSILAQFGYGALVMLSDPTTFAIGVPAGAIATAGVRAAAKAPLWKTSTVYKNSAVLTGWGAGSAIDSAVYNLPRLGGGDHTYDSTDYMLDVAADAVLGVAIGGVITGVSAKLRGKRVEHAAELESHAKRVYEDHVNPQPPNTIISGIDNEIRILEGKMEALTNARVEDHGTRTQEIQADIEKLEARRLEVEEATSITVTTPDEYVELTDVPSISTEGFTSVHAMTKKAMRSDSPILMFMNRQGKLLRDLESETPTTRAIPENETPLDASYREQLDRADQLSHKNRVKIANEINADLVKLAAAYPDGRVPASVRKTMNRLRMVQANMIRNDAVARLSGLKRGDTVSDDDLSALIVYNDVLERNPIFEGYENVPLNYAELSATMGNVIDIVRTPRTEELSEGAKEALDIGLQVSNLPQELRFIRELLDLNEAAIRSGNARLMEEVERLNGITAMRLEQLEWNNRSVRDENWAAQQVLDEGLTPGTPIYVKRLNHFVRMGKELDQQAFFDSLKTQRIVTKSERYSKTKERTPDEIRNQLKEEGVEPFTPEYRKAIEGVRQQLHGMPRPQQDKARRVLMRKIDERVANGELVRNNPEYVARKQELQYTPVQVSDAVRDVGDIQTRKTDSEIGDDTYSPNMDSRTDDGFYAGEDTAHAGNERTQKETRGKQQDIYDELGQESILPTGFRDFETVDPYKVKSEASLRRLRDDIRKELVEPVRSHINKSQAALAKVDNVLNRTYNALVKNPRKVTERAVQSENINNVYLVIRASNTLAKQIKEAKAAEATNLDTAIAGKKDELAKIPDDLKKTKSIWEKLSEPLTEEDMFALVHNRGQTTKTPKEMESIEMRVEKASEEAIKKEIGRIKGSLGKWIKEEKPMWQAAKKIDSWHDAVGKALTIWTKDIARKLQHSKVDSIEYIGHTLTELGSGYGGKVKRNFTAGLRRHAVWQDLGTDWLPSYFHNMDGYATDNFDANAIQRAQAQQRLGADDAITAAFNRDFMFYMEHQRQGKSIPDAKHKQLKHVIEFAKGWQKMTNKSHDYLVGSKIEGFTSERKQPFYVPRVHQYAKYQTAIKQHGLHKVLAVLDGAISRGKHADKVDPTAKAQEFVEWVQGQDGSTPVEDLFMPSADSRSMGRLDMDMTYEVDGLSMLDLVNTEVKELGTKYGNRVAGWVGMSDATDGLFNNNVSIDVYKEVIRNDAKAAGLNPDKYVTYFDDVVNMLFGRPTRGGLATELRMLKDLTAQTRMGGLGTAQLVETGQVLTRSTMTLFSDPKVAAKIFRTAGESVENKGLMHEIESLSRMTRDMEHFQMQSVNLDQAELARINKAREVSLRLADAATFGSHKAVASRMLGKITGFNAIRQFQSRIAQAGFAINAVRHFSGNKSQLTPKRLADLGLSEVDGTNTRLSETIKQYVEWDTNGMPSSLNVDKWPKAVRDEFQLAMLRDEAQNVQRALVGELPAWYNKPLMALIFQFRQFPLVANNKQLGRAFAFADREAVMLTMMNVASAGLVRFAKFATVAAGVATVSDRDFRRPTPEVKDMSKYVAQFGFYPDAIDLVLDAYKTYDDKGFGMDMGNKLLSTAPVWGLMKDYKDAASPESDNRERIKAAFGLMPLGNTLAADMIHARLQQELGD